LSARPVIMSTPSTRRSLVTLPDPMRHFSRNCAVVKLLALLITRLPAILLALGPALWSGRHLGWW